VKEEPWYVSAFQSGYRTVYPHRDLESARREVGYLLERGVAGRVLDLACGFGRHSIALLAAGLDVSGIDLSADLLADAPDSLAGRLARADIRHLPFADASFDAVVNLFSSFGYFAEEDDGAVLDEIARVLRPGGRAILDLMNPDRIRAGLVPESRTERDGIVLEERRSLSSDGRRVRKEVRLTLPGEAARTWTEDVRMYGTAELQALAEPRGLRLHAVEGGFDGSSFGPESERQIVHLSR